ncbi:hypothetical protein LHYA1_G007966 [Lachnellula hyalina]|uniref:Uncharacterized protein n=1 Tax=Lachnellula hyalina TaxID=1316788 RepID=A0A8H8QWI6_9HELO|nr:uncharacterized protein LHYA1_G007966 [Lachnellula hyalina]TVY24103.1 hypothetical protein LHYA1_G007966 [Lachnellula hyalina]
MKDIESSNLGAYSAVPKEETLEESFETIPFISKVVQGALFNEDDILFRQDPSPEVDDAWKTLTDIGVVIITGEEVAKLDKDPKETVKVPPSWGHGDDAHLAQPDGQHALHCLNALRRYAYREEYFPTQTKCPSNATSKIALQPYHQAHLSHCLHILLQTLTCDFSTDMITHKWMATQKFPFPDFSINKKCKDHSKLLEWQTREKISVEMWVEISERGPSKETGETVIPLPPKFEAWSETSDVDGSVIGEGAPADHNHMRG